MRMSLRLLAFFGFTLIATSLAQGQAGPQFEGTPDHTVAVPVPLGLISATTGHVHLEIPIASIPLRNSDPYITKLVYDTNRFKYVCAQSLMWCGTGAGWRLIQGTAHSGLPQYDTTQSTCTDSGYPMGTVTTYSNFRYTELDGTLHAINNSGFYTQYVNCYTTSGTRDPNMGYPTSFNATTWDKLYTFSVTNLTQMTITSNLDGWQVSPSSVFDTNGNYSALYGSNPVSVDSPAGYGCPYNTLQTPPPTSSGHINVRVSDGSTATYTVNCTAQSVSQLYSGSNVTQTVNFLSNVVLPDGSQYSFTYDTGSNPTHVGDLVGVTLTTGGQISFAYNPPSSGGPFGVSVTSATFGGGTWTFSYTGGGLGATVTTMFAPLRYDAPTNTYISDKTVFTTVNADPHLSTAQYYSGSSLLLKTLNYGYACNYLPSSLTTTLNDTSQSSSVTYQYLNCLPGHISQKQESDFSGTIVRTTKASYNGPYNKLSNVSLYSGNGSGSPISSTTYVYDEYSANYCKNGVPMLTNVTGVVNHDDTNHGIGFTNRGNVTTVQRLISGTTYATAHTCYDTVGGVTQQVDALGNPTSFDYTEIWSDTNCIPAGTLTRAYPTTITNALGFRRRTSHFTCTQLTQSQANENDLRASRSGTTYTFDNMNRPLSLSYPDTGQTTISYLSPTSTVTNKATGSGNLQTTRVLDGYGRLTQAQLNSDPDCSAGDKTDTTYDALGRVASVSNPYCTTSDPTYGITATAYDALGRVTRVTNPDGSNVTSSYVGVATKVSDEGNGTQPVQRVSQADPLGRLVSVCEVSSTTLTGSGGTPANCGQSIAATGFLTTYQYDVLDNLTQVSQGTLSARTFVYDGLSRLTTATNPESGTETYGYDSNGNLLTKQSPAPNQTSTATVTVSYCYDALNRMTAKAFTYSPSALPACSGTPPTFPAPVATSAYDLSSVDGLSPLNSAGRLVKAATSDGKTATVNSYDPMGRIKNQWQCTPQNCGTAYLSLPYNYDLLGNVTSSGNGAGVTLSYSFNAASHLTSLTSSLSDTNHPGTLLSGLQYNAMATPVADSLGNNVTESISYTTRGSPQTLSAKTASTPVTPATGSGTVNGTEQSQNIPASPGTGTVTINGYERSVTVNPCSPFSCPQTYWDNGTVSVTVNGFVASVTYGQSSGNSSVASALKTALNASNSPVTASCNPTNCSNAIITLTSKVAGSASNYTLSAASGTNDPSHFSGSSFPPTTSGSNLTGGLNAYTLYDAGSVWISVNGFQAAAGYSQSSTTASLVSALATSLNATTSPVTASASGSSLTITTKMSGASTNYPFNAGSSTNYPANFSQPSFTISLSGSSLTGGSGGIYSFDLVHSANGDVLTANDSVNGNWTYSYDAFNRLTGGNQNSGQFIYSWVYDRYGNRWQQNGVYHPPNLTFNGNNNRIDGYSYDAAGNLMNDGSHSYAYDAENRITQVDGGSTASYIYDASGRRIRKTTASNGAVDFLYDPSGNEITELSSTGAWNRGEVYAAGRHLATYANNATYFIHSDWLGTERARTSATGSLYETCTSLPFGDWLTCSSSDVSPMHFTGKERDAESGLDYFGARFDSSSFGRFMSPDPEGAGSNGGIPQSWNAYSYAGNNPTLYVDPDGTTYLICVKNDDGHTHCTIITDEEFSKLQKDPGAGISLRKGRVYGRNGLEIGGYVQLDVDLPQDVSNALHQAGVWGQTGVNYAMIATLPNFLVVGGAHITLYGGLTTLGPLVPYFGNKLDYLFGLAQDLGPSTEHNVQRSVSMLEDMESVGLLDTPQTREYVVEKITEAFNNPAAVSKITSAGKVVDVFLMGPNGGVKLEVAFQGARVITMVTKR